MKFSRLVFEPLPALAGNFSEAEIGSNSERKETFAVQRYVNKMYNKYIGHELQLYSVTEMRLTGGKADGMRIYLCATKRDLPLRFHWTGAAIFRLSLKAITLVTFAPVGMCRQAIMIIAARDF